MGELTIYRRRPGSMLLALRQEWEAQRRWRHAQATGFFLYELARVPEETATTYLTAILDFVSMHGIYGVDGLLFSAMAAAEHLNPPGFKEASALCDGMTGSLKERPHGDMGIFVLDFGISDFGFSSTNRIGRGTDMLSYGLRGTSGSTAGRLGGGRFGVSRSLTAGLLSGFPDSFRSSVFNGGGLNNILGHTGGFGVGVREEGSSELSASSPIARQTMYATTEGGCVAGWALAGAIIGGVGAGAASSGTATMAGIEFGAVIGGLAGGLYCGAKYDPNPPAPAGSGGAEGGPGSGGTGGAGGSGAAPAGSGSGAAPSGSGDGAAPSGSGDGAAPSGSGTGAPSSGSGSGAPSSGSGAGATSGSGSGEAGDDEDPNTSGVSSNNSETYPAEDTGEAGGQYTARLPGEGVLLALGLHLPKDIGGAGPKGGAISKPMPAERLGGGNFVLRPDVNDTSRIYPNDGVTIDDYQAAINLVRALAELNSAVNPLPPGIR